MGFEEIVFHIERGDLLDILEHPNPERYTGQGIFVFQREDYVYLLPFVEDEHTASLPTVEERRSKSDCGYRWRYKKLVPAKVLTKEP